MTVSPTARLHPDKQPDRPPSLATIAVGETVILMTPPVYPY